jgi:hypothetical protein
MYVLGTKVMIRLVRTDQAAQALPQLFCGEGKNGFFRWRRTTNYSQLGSESSYR